MRGPKRTRLLLAFAAATFLACDGEPSIGITTALPLEIRPPGAHESLLKSMCESISDYKDEHVKVMWLRPQPRGGVLFTRTYFCTEVVKRNFKALP